MKVYFKNIFFFLFFHSFTVIVNGQNDLYQCGTVTPSLLWENEFQKFIAETKAKYDADKSSLLNYTIPVIFHVIHGGEPIGTYPNILQGQVESQINVLNNDFIANAYNVTDYPLNAFVNWASAQNIPASGIDQLGRIKIADFNIQFCLATIDPNGNLLSEPGIDRINYLEKGWASPAQFGTQASMKSYLDNEVKPGSVWDVTKYLNIWITDKSNSLTYAGVSTVPPFSGLMDIPNTATDSTDGIWCFAKALGSYQLFPAGSYISSYIDGRTMTHEAGHYLGLRHIWGDATCGNDFCDDTPPASAQNTGSPTYPHNSGSCLSPSNQPDGEMFMNFMDYTMGPSKYMFTTDQMIRAQTAMLNSPFRNQLGTHGLCSPLGSIDDMNQLNIVVYPNPADHTIRINIKDQHIKFIRLYSQFGELKDQFFTTEFSVENLQSGLYFISAFTDQGMYSGKFVKK